MGHSRGGDAVTSFLDFNRTRPEPGRRYTGIRGVISLAPTDYERRAPYGVAYMSYLPYCDGDVSNLQGARFYERSQYIAPDDPYPAPAVRACTARTTTGSTRRGSSTATTRRRGDRRVLVNTTNARAATRGAEPEQHPPERHEPGQPATRARAPPATTAPATRRSWAIRRRPASPSWAASSAATSARSSPSTRTRPVSSPTAARSRPTARRRSSRRRPARRRRRRACASRCLDRFKQSYFAPPAERRDVIRPETDQPLTLSALGTALTGSGFSNPYLAGGGVSPLPATTAGGYDWCNPEPNHFTPTAVGETGNPTAFKACPLPAAAGARRPERRARERAGQPLLRAAARARVGRAGGAATRIPAGSSDVTQFKSLTLGRP